MIKKDDDLAEVRKLSELADTKFVTTGVKEIDELVGGFPRGRLTELYGKEQVGKTSLMAMCLASISQDSKMLYIDAENALNKARMAKLGAVAENIDFTNEYQLEKVADLVTASVDNFDIIIVDSIAALATKTELEGETGAANIGVKAKLMHQWMRKMIGKLGRSDCALVFINQLRESPDLYTQPFTTGGRAIPFAASLRIQLSRNNSSDIIKKKVDGKEVIEGVWIHVDIKKSKVSQPHLSTKFKLRF